MGTIINIILFIIILGILIFVHEFGHFITAKKSGVHIHEFSIGMGPLIKCIKGKDGIDYCIRALPIGGFVQMAGEVYEDDDTNTVAKEKFLCNRPWYQRLIILCAGVFNNFLLAIIILFAIALIWGAPSLKPVIHNVTEGKPVAEAGIVAGDTITAVNGKKVSTWDKTQLLLLVKSKDNIYEIEVKHEDGNTESYKIQPEITKDEKGNETKIFGIEIKSEIEKGFVPAFKYAFKKFASTLEQMWLTITELFTGGISINNLSGPVGIYTVVGETRKNGIENILALIAYLSINLGIMNILPIPALDGGHVLFLIIELITKKKVNEKVEGITTTIFFALLMILMIYITIHDIITLIL
ncbi:MAG TPA: RIP metalloprotease RseP [Firmicutes bacterium]|nr:RIP metalloprotease RseP [Bacillota bacterium]